VLSALLRPLLEQHHALPDAPARLAALLALPLVAAAATTALRRRAPGPRAAALGALPLAAAGPLLLSAAGRSWPASVAGALLMGAGFGLALGAARAHASARALRGDARALQVFNDLPNAGSLIGFGLMLPATALGGLPAGLLLAGALGLGAAAVALAQPAAEGSAGSSR